MIKMADLDKIRPGIRQKDSSIYVNRIRNHWCPFAKGQHKCDMQCSTNLFCAPVIERATNLSQAREPVALLVHILKDECKKAEKTMAREAEKPQLREIDMNGKGDAFAELARSLGL